MTFQSLHLNSLDSDAAALIYSKTLLGITPANSVPAKWDTLLSTLPTPPQQKAYNIKTGRTEPFKALDPLTFYAADEERVLLVKCTEWTEERAIPALLQAGLIQTADVEGVGDEQLWDEARRSWKSSIEPSA
jgi:hypothetical protein